MLQDSGFTDVVTGEPVDTFGGAKGEEKPRAFQVYGYTSRTAISGCAAGICARAERTRGFTPGRRWLGRVGGGLRERVLACLDAYPDRAIS
jgi:hypothetical protein